MSAARRRLGQGVAVAVAALLTVALAQSTTTAALTAQTGSGGNQATASANFCAAPGAQTVAVTEDSPAYQANASTTYGSYASVGAISQSAANARSVLRFALPAPPAHCALTSAVLRLYATRSDTGATLDVYRIDPADTGWTEAGISWNTFPDPTGTAATGGTPGTLGWHSWTVNTQTAALYTGPNSGFLLRERTEGAGVGRWQLYESKEAGTVANRPQLVLTWG
jgi:hypothetical protein